MRVDLKWSDFNSERMELQILQRWFCSVASPCIAEAIHWSQPAHKVEKMLFWKSGVSTFCLCKVILKTSSVTKRLQLLCCQQTIYRLFVDILPRYDLFWWLVPEKIAFCLQLSGSKYRYFILGQTEHHWLMFAEIFFLRVSQQALQLHSFYPAIFYRCFAVTFPFQLVPHLAPTKSLATLKNQWSKQMCRNVL